MQKAVDALALAAAAELDRSPSSIQRADTAMSGVIADRTRFADGGEVARMGIDLGNVTVSYLCDLRADDGDPIDTRDCSAGGDVTTSPRIAEFAWVWVVGVAFAV